MDKNASNKRKSIRRLHNIKILFHCDNFQYLGTVTNCSETGMCIKTTHYISCDDNIGIIIPLEEEIINLSGRVIRIAKGDNIYRNIGVELLNPPPKYSAYLENL